jgi:hypothetical protein
LFKDKIKEVITLSPPKGGDSYSPPKQGQETPPNQPTPTPISDDYKFEVLENFSVEYFSSTTGKNTIANFKKGQIIHAKPIPMGNVGGLATTPDGKYPNIGLIGNAIVNVPQNKLRRVLDK